MPSSPFPAPAPGPAAPPAAGAAASGTGAALRLHGLGPVVAAHTRVLVLGSFPSVASLQARAYYAHPRNQFWPLLGALWQVPLADWPYQQRLNWVLQRGLGIWDVYAQCRRAGSLDADIRDAEPNDLRGLVARLPQLALIAHNGGESARAMRVTRTLGVPVCRLPSTSPANASWSFARKCRAWADALASSGLPGLAPTALG